jgi:osmoprotectant transport system ATP-binding protein
MISVKNLSKKFDGVEAVSDISFEVEEGSTLVLLGTSGCGKTTTLKMINRLIEPTSGEIKINRRSILDQEPEELRRNIGYVSQNNGLFPHFTVSENIAVVPKLLNWDKQKIKNRTAELLDQLKLPLQQYGQKYPGELSGGQKQRVSLARALVSDPPLLLMDEPFGALDPITRVGIRKEFLELPELKRKTIVLVTHDVQEAFELGDQVSLMDKGKIVQNGSPSDLLFKPADDFVGNFFKDQKLQLELGSLKISAIWDQLPENSAISGKEMKEDLSFWEALEILSGEREGSFTMTNTRNNQTRSLTFENVFAAYFKIKQNF